MTGQAVAVLIETRDASYLAAFHGELVGPEEGPGDERWMINDGQEPVRYDGTWFIVPSDCNASLSEGTVVLRHAWGTTTVTADRPLGEKLESWKRPRGG